LKKYYIQTFGCSMNQADSEKINMILMQSGFVKVSSWREANLVIFNTCSVRKKWEDRVFGTFREIDKENKKRDNKIIVGITWCMVRKTGVNRKYIQEEIKREKAKKIELLNTGNEIFNNDDKLFPRIPNLDFTLRIEEVKYLNQVLSRIYNEPIGIDDKFDDYLKQKQLRENPNQAQIIIQTWCDNYCTFCIVPYTRWKEISRKKEEILEEIKEAVEWWAKEINLIGQNVNSYGKQFVDKELWNEEKSSWDNWIGKSPFRDLLESIDQLWVERLRFTSSNPHDMTSDILASHFDLKSPCNYLHFALQSWNNQVLKKMNRKHSYIDFKKQVEYLRSRDPLFSISTDIIVWYSWETEEMFQDTLDAIEECEFDFVYNARYSVRPWTIAAKLYPDDVPDKTKAERWHILNNLMKQNVGKRSELMIGREEDILISWEKDNQFFWRTRNFKEVFFEKKEWIKVWDIVVVKIIDLDKWVLRGSLI